MAQDENYPEKTYIAVGMMTGTSMDGLDVAAIRTDGKDFVRLIGFTLIPYENDFHNLLKTVLRGKDKERLEAVGTALTQMHALALENLLLKMGLDVKEVDVIGMHGQTVLHEPEKGRTWQIGDGQMLADMTGVQVVNDFRSADMKAGGQGAPLIPVYHRALAKNSEKPAAFVNIGGVANLTWIDKRGNMLACDTGPGNALLDDWMRQKTGAARDENGETAAAGKVDKAALKKLLSHPFFAMPPPKSLDRDAFDPSLVAHLSVEDGAATLAEFTVEGIARIVEMLPEAPRKWLVCGGGRHNAHIMARLSDRLGIAVEPVEAIGAHGDTLEAEGFAYMAVRHLLGLPISFPGTTGVREEMTGGVLSLPKTGEKAKL